MNREKTLLMFAGAHSDVTEIQTPAIGVPEIELQKLLSSELLRSERHKMNYETLKEDHQR